MKTEQPTQIGTLYFPGERTVIFLKHEDSQVTAEFGNFQLTPSETVIVGIMSETLRCYAEGRDIHLYFNPTENPTYRRTLVKCLWERSGLLRVIKEGLPGEVEKRVMCHTVEEALDARRSFTCYKTLVRDLPQRRSGGKKKGM